MSDELVPEGKSGMVDLFYHSVIFCFFVDKCQNHVYCTILFTFHFSLSEKLHKFISEQQQKGKRVPLCLNPNSISFKSFQRFVF